jgi:hypothetical protein
MTINKTVKMKVLVEMKEIRYFIIASQWGELCTLGARHLYISLLCFFLACKGIANELDLVVSFNNIQILCPFTHPYIFFK